MSEFANGAERSALHWLARFRGTCQQFKYDVKLGARLRQGWMTIEPSPAVASIGIARVDDTLVAFECEPAGST